MAKNKGISCPEGSILVALVDDREWMFEYPRLEWEIYELFHDAIDEWQMGDVDSAEDTYRELIADYPEFIDVYQHLALLLGETGRGEEAFQIWREVVAFGLACLPVEFEVGRDILSWLMVDNRPFLRAYHGLGLEYLERGKAFFREVVSQGLEGVMAKTLSGPYLIGRRSRLWLKIKPRQEKECTVVGYTEGSGARRRTFGALLLATRDDQGWRYRGKVGSGFTQSDLQELAVRLRELETDSPPLRPAPSVKGVQWVRPELRVRSTSRKKPTGGISGRRCF